MPISRIRSKTDIAIVFVTAIPPTISASSEMIQPVEMITRLDVSILTTWPGSVTAVVPGKSCSSRRATSRGLAPSETATEIVVTSPGRPARRCTTPNGSTIPPSSNGSPVWKMPPIRKRRRPSATLSPGRKCFDRARTSPTSA